MSYCRFENTYKDLCDCYEHMDSITSEREYRERIALIMLCRQIVDEYGDLEVEEMEEDI